MTVRQIKEEMQALDLPELEDLASFLLRLRRQRDPERKQAIASKVDLTEGHWVSLEEFDRRTAE